MRKLILLFTVAALVLLGNAVQSEESVYFRFSLQSTGILTVQFDPNQTVEDSLSIVETNVDAGFMPGWLTSYRDKVYSISRTHDPNNASVSGGLFAFRQSSLLNGTYPNLTLFSQTTSDGLGGVACDVSPDGRTLAAANIDGSAVSIHPLSRQGDIGNASYVFHYNLTHPGPGTNDSQIRSNPHEAIFDPKGKYLFVADRGADHLYVYSVGGPDNVTQIQNITLLPGTGPRHMTFRPFNTTRTYMYLVSELDNTVRVFTLDYFPTHPVGAQIHPPAAVGGISIILKQTISTLGPNLNRSAPNNHDLASEIAISNDGRFVYVSNRNTVTLESDNIALFARKPNASDDKHHLTYLGSNLTYGKTPRNFALSKDIDNRYLAVGNEVTQSVMVIERDIQSGFLKRLKGNLTLGPLDVTQNYGPSCILWV